MDLNGDGIMDFVSGDYESGNIYYFEGTKTGFKAKQIIHEEWQRKDCKVPQMLERDGKQIINPAWEMASVPMDRQMGTVSFIDWDADGDTDMIVGNVSGKIYLNINQGTKMIPKFGKRVPLIVNGNPMQVYGKSDPAPVDWDGDGIIDVIVGDELGGITFFKGNKDRTFEPGLSLFTGNKIASGDRDWWNKDRGWEQLRIRICVTDWNNDGKLDVLVGHTGFYGKPSGVSVLLQK